MRGLRRSSVTGPPLRGAVLRRGDSLECSPRGAEDSRLSEEDEDNDLVASAVELLWPRALSLPLDWGAEAEKWVKTDAFATSG